MSNFQAAAPRAVKFSKVGSSVTGIVHQVDTEMQMSFTAENRPNGPRFDENGNVVLTTVVTLATTDDNGDPTTNLVKLRVGDSIFTDKGREVMRTTSGLAVAIADAVSATGADDLNVGDTLTITYIGDEEATTDGYNPAKVYQAKIAA